MEDVILKEHGKSGHIILNRPDKINSLTHEMILEIDENLRNGKKKILLPISLCMEQEQEDFVLEGT